ncbi:hypothetical protein PTTG_28614, partial [Puccinia triticina 1-1 BBBD Race 1]
KDELCSVVFDGFVIPAYQSGHLHPASAIKRNEPNELPPGTPPSASSTGISCLCTATIRQDTHTLSCTFPSLHTSHHTPGSRLMMITLSRPARTLLLVSLCLFVSMQVDALPTSPHSSGYSLAGAAGHRAAAVSRRHPSTGPSALARRSGNGLDLSVQLDLPILGSMGALNLGGQIDGFIPGMPYGVRSSL